MERIVFLDRNLLQTPLRTVVFEHHWQEYASTRSDEVVARLQGATIAITNRVVLSEPTLAQLPSLRFIAIVGTGTDCVDLEACQQRGKDDRQTFTSPSVLSVLADKPGQSNQPGGISVGFPLVVIVLETIAVSTSFQHLEDSSARSLIVIMK